MIFTAVPRYCLLALKLLSTSSTDSKNNNNKNNNNNNNNKQFEQGYGDYNLSNRMFFVSFFSSFFLSSSPRYSVKA